MVVILWLFGYIWVKYIFFGSFVVKLGLFGLVMGILVGLCFVLYVVKVYYKGINLL